MTNSIQKGKRGEREAVKFLKSLGFEDARRTQQYSGTEGTSDVVCPESLPSVHIEVKFGYPKNEFDLGTTRLEMACHQARFDSNGGLWVVLWKSKGSSKWRLSFEWYGLLVTVADSDLIRQVLIAYEEGSNE